MAIENNCLRKFHETYRTNLKVQYFVGSDFMNIDKKVVAVAVCASVNL